MDYTLTYVAPRWTMALSDSKHRSIKAAYIEASKYLTVVMV
ncbi:hypothetical protein [Psychromonas sp. MB-3u-54]|nr:hypothetical protein [Psychromonas sp. MB-3u-54]